MNSPEAWMLSMVPALAQDVGLTVAQVERLTTYLTEFINAYPENWVRLLADEGTAFDKELEVSKPLSLTRVCPDPSVGKDIRVLLWSWVDDSPSPEYAARRIRFARTILVGLKKWSLTPSTSTSKDDADSDAPISAGFSSDNEGKQHVNKHSFGSVERACISDFVARQVSLRSMAVGSKVSESVRIRMRELLAMVFQGYETQEFVPRFGPGAVFEGLDPLQKWGHIGENIPEVLRKQFGKVSFVSGINALSEDPVVEPGPRGQNTSRARLWPVLKDLWKWRIITIPLLHFSFCQQGCKSKILACMRKCPLTRGLEITTGQEKHARLAREASRTGREATLDLTDASDWQTWALVQEEFPPAVSSDLGACRATKVVDPTTGDETELLSYDGMGNATTFVVETLLFWSCCFAVAEEVLSWLDDISIHVYGDDIICDTRIVPRLSEVFSDLGWKLNMTKSFYNPEGRFRESCGSHWWHGHDVRPLRFYGYSNSPEDRIAVAQKVRDLNDDDWAATSELLARTFGVPYCASVPPGTFVGDIPQGVFCCNTAYVGQNQVELRHNRAYQRTEALVGSIESLKCDWKGSSTWGHVLSSLLGYQLSSRSALTKRTVTFRARSVWPHTSIVQRALPYLSAALPRRVRYKPQGWFPTSPSGVASPEVAMECAEKHLRATRAPLPGIHYRVREYFTLYWIGLHRTY